MGELPTSPDQTPEGALAINPKWIASNANANLEVDQYQLQTAFRTASWSPDGTTLVATNTSDQLQSYVVPSDLLTDDTHHNIQLYSSWQAPSTILASTTYPFFNLANPSTTLVLSSTRDHPIQLRNALSLDAGLVASYPCENELTESVHAMHALAFTTDGTHFVAGTKSLLAVYDVSRNGDAPTELVKTIPSKRDRQAGGGVGVKGIISSLSISSAGILAAGMFSRGICLYGDEGRGKEVAAFSIDHVTESEDYLDLSGTGITQVAWSPCARYLYVALRQSDAVLVYDIRVAGKRLGWLDGRNAKTNQRLAIDVVQVADGHEIWAGGMDGRVRVWKNPGQAEGVVGPLFEWPAHKDPVVTSLVHQSGSVVATFSAPSRTFPPDHSDPESSGSEASDAEQDEELKTWRASSFDPPRQTSNEELCSSLKIWSL